MLYFFGRFDFVKSVAVEIFVTRLQEGQEATAKVLKHVAGTGPIYIRARQSIERNDEVSYLTVLHLQLLHTHCNKICLSIHKNAHVAFASSLILQEYELSNKNSLHKRILK